MPGRFPIMAILQNPQLNLCVLRNIQHVPLQQQSVFHLESLWWRLQVCSNHWVLWQGLANRFPQVRIYQQTHGSRLSGSNLDFGSVDLIWLEEGRGFVSLGLCGIIRSPRESVGFPPLSTGTEMDDEVILGELFRPPGLAAVVDLCFGEPEQVVVVRINRDLLSQSLKEMEIGRAHV